MRDGKSDASIAQSPAAMGRRAVLSAWRLLWKEPVDAEQPVAIRLVTKDSLGAP